MRVYVCVYVCVFVVLCSCTCTAYICRLSGAADCSGATGFGQPNGVALDPSSGAVFVTNYNPDTYAKTVCRVPAGGGADDSRA